MAHSIRRPGRMMPGLAATLALALLTVPAAASAQIVDEPPPADFSAVVAAADAGVARGGTGPFPAIMVSDPRLPTHTLYRPKDLAAVTGKLPIVAWGNGACANIGNRFRYYLTEIASHGYLILATGPAGPKVVEWKINLDPTDRRPPAERPAASQARQMNDAIDWAVAENKRRGSPYFGRLDTRAIAVMGQSCGGLQAIAAAADPRVRTAMVLNSGTFPNGTPPLDGTGGATKASLASLRIPVAWITGDASDIAFNNADADFAAATIPALRAYEKGTGHSDAYGRPDGGSFAVVSTAWLDWQLKNERKAARFFIGSDCTLCTDPNWVMRKKDLP